MGCTSSIPRRYTERNESKKKRKKTKKSLTNEVAVYVPAVRVPLCIDLVHPLRGLISRELLQKLCTLRGRIVTLSEEENQLLDVDRISELRKALEEYLPVLLGLTKKDNRLESLVEFKWKTLEDDQECNLWSAWYEVLSVIHMMAMISLLEANLMLIPRENKLNNQDGMDRKVFEDAKKDVIDLLLKASGCLDYCVHHIFSQIPLQIRKDLPSNLQQGTLEAISIQALAQGVEMQLGLAQGCDKATLSVKRRLSCELFSYFSQALFVLSGCDTSDSYGKKLILFVKWKFLEAKAVAYYYHGLVVDKGSEPSCHISAVSCLCGAHDLLNDSKRACLSFCLATPVTRVPPPWGIMKNLHKKIPDIAYKKSQMHAYLFEQDKNNGALQSLPDLPEFPLSLRSDGYELPNIDPLWENEDCGPQIQSLKEHLRDEDDELECVNN